MRMKKKKFVSFDEMKDFYLSGKSEVFAKRNSEYEILNIGSVRMNDLSFLEEYSGNIYFFKDTEYFYN